ncbi:MAG: SURF1 family cytochrome oxidase biogenesis protein, partial [Caulobacteraceae bacterium]
MTASGGAGRGAFPIGLTFAAAIGLAALLGLGVWQVQRLKWKQDLLARIAALQGAPPRSIGPVLMRAATGQAVEFTRVAAACVPPPRPSPMVFRYALRGGQIGWRAIAPCRLADEPYDGILLDRGLVARFAGAMATGAAKFPEPGAVPGALRAGGGAWQLHSGPAKRQ